MTPVLPLFRNKNLWRAYALSWIPLGILYRYALALTAKISASESLALTIPLVLLLFVACTIPSYTCRWLPIGRVSLWRAGVGHVVMTMLVSSAVILIMRGVALAWSGVFPGLVDRFGAASPALTVAVALTYLLATAWHYTVQAMEAAKQAEIESREAQLKALKAQVNPHFLFNSLNSISALTAVDPARARQMCIRLSDFLRASLRLGECTTIPFAEEVALTHAYLDVEQIRFGDRLRVKQDIQDDCDRCDVPPLLLQPLVENAIRHGIATLVEGGEITITSARIHDTIHVNVENAFDPDAPTLSKTGFGLANVRNRLRARWGSKAKMEIQVNRNRYSVVLTFPFQPGKQA
jgi:hypothetical protein